MACSRSDLCTVQQICLPLRFFHAHKILQCGFRRGDGGFQPRDLFLHFQQRSFICLSLMGFRRFCFVSGSGFSAVLMICLDSGVRRNAALFEAREPSAVALLFPFFAPEIIFIVAGKDFHPPLANFKDARRQLVNEVAVVRNEDDRAGKLLQ